MAEKKSEKGRLTKREIKQYLNANEPYCPYCKGKDLAYGSLDVEGNGAYQEVTCNGCGRRWADSYQLVGLVEID